MPQALSYLQILFPEQKERTKAIGYLGITLGVASILGLFLGGYLSGLQTVIAGWRLIFFINLPIGLIALVAASKYVEETKLNRGGKFDFAGVILLTMGLGSLIYPLAVGREQHWPLWSIAMLLFSAIIFYVFIRDQQQKLTRAKNPLMDTRLFICVAGYLLLAVTVVIYHTGSPLWQKSTANRGEYFDDQLRRTVFPF